MKNVFCVAISKYNDWEIASENVAQRLISIGVEAQIAEALAVQSNELCLGIPAVVVFFDDCCVDEAKKAVREFSSELVGGGTLVQYQNDLYPQGFVSYLDTEQDLDDLAEKWLIGCDLNEISAHLKPSGFIFKIDDRAYMVGTILGEKRQLDQNWVDCVCSVCMLSGFEQPEFVQ